MFGLDSRTDITYLIVAPCCLDYGSTKTCCNANRYATNHATHKDIPQHALLSIPNQYRNFQNFMEQNRKILTLEQSRR
jgi:hypothetical protein